MKPCMNFYDIESLRNVFTLANYQEPQNNIEIFILCDNPELMYVPDFQRNLLQRIYEKNHNFNGTITLYDLATKEANDHLAETFGLSDAPMINDPSAKSHYPDNFRIICDTDPDYDMNVHPFFSGYNSYNYDTTMLAAYLDAVYQSKRAGVNEHDPKATSTGYTVIAFHPTTASFMRDINNLLFEQFRDSMPTYLTKRLGPEEEPDYSNPGYLIRRNMLLSGRHLDVARLNEKQSKVGLKRILGMLGFQILESNKLRTGADTIETTDQLYDLIAYNVSDVVNLPNVFYHKLYQGQFSLKKGLLSKYPELVYNKIPDEYKPNISPRTVRRDRLNIDSSSAQFATKALCPYGHLSDMDTVSYLYPATEKAKELGIKQVNVLEEAKEFFYKLFPQPEVRAQFDPIYNYYKSIEGKNFNGSKNYMSDRIDEIMTDPDKTIKVYNLQQIPKCPNNLPYFDKDGKPTSCFVTFSTGGIHGAEYNKELFEHDMEQYEKRKAVMSYVQSVYPNPVDLRKAKRITMPDGTERPYNEFLRSGKKIANSEYKDIEKTKPVLFKLLDDGSTKLNTDYAYTSSGIANHEDFTSYYPNLLRMMMAFYNKGLGYDRYAEIFDQKQEYGGYMKDKKRPEAEREEWSVLREGTKLILNSASGAGDTNFESNIRMNNTIISMRIIGQLFSWRIGQAQAYAGAKMISTNTDGLYSVMEATLNNQILAKESADIGVEIEPEPLYLISKDTNNRLELDLDSNQITGASGGTLACRKRPDPAKSLAHPAIIDWALSEYLVTAAQHQNGLSLDAPFDESIGRNILYRASQEFKPIDLLLMFQNIIASSIGSVNYIFGLNPNDPNTPIILPHYNRVFIMKDNTPGTIHLMSATAKVITAATARKRERDNNGKKQLIDPIAYTVLCAHGAGKQPLTKDIVQKKVTGIETDWFLYIQNKNLHDLTPSELQFLSDNLDYNKYLELLKNGFENNWRNHRPGETAA